MSVSAGGVPAVGGRGPVSPGRAQGRLRAQRGAVRGSGDLPARLHLAPHVRDAQSQAGQRHQDVFRIFRILLLLLLHCTRLTAFFQGQSGSAGTRKVKPV